MMAYDLTARFFIPVLLKLLNNLNNKLTNLGLQMAENKKNNNVNDTPIAR